MAKRQGLYTPGTERILDQLRNAILSGQLAPGTRLFHAELAEQFEVSQTPVREAVRSLIAENLVQYAPRRGAYVIDLESLSVREVTEVYQLRGSLEGLACRLAAERVGPADVAHLEQLHRSMAEAVQDGRTSRFVEANRAFHFCIFDQSGNRRLKSELLRYWVLSPSNVTRAMEERSRGSIAEHAAILGALALHDADAAEQAARRHVAGALPLALQLVETDRMRFAPVGRRR